MIDIEREACSARLDQMQKLAQSLVAGLGQYPLPAGALAYRLAKEAKYLAALAEKHAEGYTP